MPGTQVPTPIDLLDSLYEAALDSSHWPYFLGRLSGHFCADTATLRITDIDQPVVFKSFTVGFDEAANRRYTEQSLTADPFREPLASGPLGVIQASHDIVPDREFERSEHYQQVFRPNGNFYAMGAHFERRGRQAAYIGVHRPRCRGPFTPAERRRLQFFSPHLRRAARTMQLLGDYELALAQSRWALDQLPFALWLVNDRLGCQWMNAAAEEVVRRAELGLGLTGGRLTSSNPSACTRLRAALEAICRWGKASESVLLAYGGASLVLTRSPEGRGALIFLLDPMHPVRADSERLHRVYELTPAEIRLATQLLNGRDLNAASACLGVSIHTARSQLKACMRKLEVTRQCELVRKLLVCCSVV